MLAAHYQRTISGHVLQPDSLKLIENRRNKAQLASRMGVVPNSRVHIRSFDSMIVGRMTGALYRRTSLAYICSAAEEKAAI